MADEKRLEKYEKLPWCPLCGGPLKPGRAVYLLTCGFEEIFHNTLVYELVVSEEEFRGICNSAVQEAVERLLVRADRRITTRGILEEAERILVEKGGFRRVPHVRCWYQFSILDRPEEVERVFPSLPEDLRRRLVDHNREVMK